jgi:hypothetical protein
MKTTSITPPVPDRGFVVVDGDRMVIADDDGRVVAEGPSGGFATNERRPLELTVEPGVIRLRERRRAPIVTDLFPPDCEAELDGRAPNVARCGPSEAELRRIEIRDAAGRRTLIETPPRIQGMTGEVLGHWASVELSPDGRSVLAGWSGECEAPTAFVLPFDGEGTTADGTPLASWADAPESSPAGWTSNGRARFVVGAGACGTGLPSRGVYAVVPGEEPELIYRANSEFPTAYSWRQPAAAPR